MHYYLLHCDLSVKNDVIFSSHIQVEVDRNNKESSSQLAAVESAIKTLKSNVDSTNIG